MAACGLVTADNDPVADVRFALAGACSDLLVTGDGSGGIDGSVRVGHDGHRGWPYSVTSAPDVRGGGIGRRMVEAAVDRLRRRGVVKAQLLVRETSAGVIPFSERLGFETVPRTIMSKRLDRPDAPLPEQARPMRSLSAMAIATPCPDHSAAPAARRTGSARRSAAEA